MAKKTGRPTSYKPEYSTKKYREQFIAHCEEEEEVVTLCGLAVYMGVCEDTLYEWVKVNKSFSESTRIIKQISKNQMFQGGLKGKLNSHIVKLGLSANHGMCEKKIIEDDRPIEVSIKMPKDADI